MYKDHQIQPLAPFRATQQSDHTCERGVHTPFEFQQLKAVPTALAILFPTHRPLVQNLLTPSCTPSDSSVPFPRES